ncbi:putative dehydrogenase [Pullulanibacillus pueri]|uniref:Dehydrogenase n=1 Tax=Pullulanibacillus pueri TaxID=1437324 RepID=A0A8J3ELR1_9BACL|nr:Gfo/Idh/MocA family oxidoreductase [Pullulanibacillus pueri]MBM7682078.1 putative dehydrogenase [Pullulanibacillus pueri]GGH80069.1 dehydrogenase [Pullulanibacillus pueri]
MSKKLKVAVVGLGTMGKVHADAWAHIEHAELVGVCDLDRVKAETIAESYDATPYQDLSEMLEQSNVDVIDVCLPTYLHKENVALAAQAGKHVVCEKPLGLNVQDAQDIISVCEDHGVQLFVAQVVRFFPEYAQASAKVKSGGIGKPGVVRLTRGGGFPRAWEDWYADEAKSGRLILDSMIHDFDWLRWTFGDVERVMTRRVSRSDEDRPLEYALVTLRMEDGTIAHVEGTWAHATFHTSFELTGDKGMVVHDSAVSAPLSVSLHHNEGDASKNGVAVPESPLNENPYLRELKHFAHCILTGSEPIVTAYDALKAVEISQAALESAKTGQPVVLAKMGGGVR